MSVKSLKTGTRSISMLAGNTPEHHVLIAESTVGAGGAASVTFSNIPADYQHLQIRGIIKATTSASDLNWTFNSDTGANYSWHYLTGNGSSAGSSAGTSTTKMQMGPIMDTQIGGHIVDILDYASTGKYKTVRSLAGYDNNGAGLIYFSSGSWRSTSAVTSITVFGTSSNIAQHSTFQLYGVK